VRPLRIGVSGLGNIGRRHLATLDSLPDFEVVAAADPVADAGAVRPGLSLFADFDEMVETAGLDAVIVCTPSWLHGPQGAAAARRGLHVVTEKPMAIDLDGADDLLTACGEHDVRLAVLHQYRFHAPAVQLRGMLEDGTLGDLVCLTITQNWRRDPAYYQGSGSWRGTWAGDGGGALMNQGSHGVDLARWLAGPIASVAAQTTNVAHHAIETEDTVCASMQFVGGGLGTLQVTTAAARNEPLTVQVLGTKGTAVLAGSTLTLDGEDVDDRMRTAPDKDRPHRMQFEAIASSLAAERVPPVEGADARETLAATLAMYEAARRARPGRAGLTHVGGRAHPRRELPGRVRARAEEAEAVARVMQQRSLFRYYGIGEPGEVAAYETEWAAHVGRRHALAVNSGTSALFCALVAAGVGPGDEVIMPSFAWASDANVILQLGAVPVVVDVDDTLTLDPAAVECHLTPRTAAILPVHMRGAPSDMHALLAIGERAGVPVVEDACQAAGVLLDGRRAGAFGLAAAFSTQYAKLVVTGEGGVVLTDDERCHEAALDAHDPGAAMRRGAPPSEYPASTCAAPSCRPRSAASSSPGSTRSSRPCAATRRRSPTPFRSAAT
jgi:predicted dehydrogenase